ncbi:proline--tRNA ligase [Roseiflexus castenholzii]|uniref:proline--tRNA ligase n=1 Tax=Roseiflexus castenholzii TaxID=120962 RepID=UPI003C7E0855
MRISALFGRTLRETPADIDYPALRLMLRAGLARLSAGALTFLPIGTRVLRRLEAMAHEELTRIGAQEIHLPPVRTLSASDRVQSRLLPASSTMHGSDQSRRLLAFDPTDTTTIASLAASEIASYRQLPALLYQRHPVSCSDCRSSWLREEIALTVYALGGGARELEETGTKVCSAFECIFRRCDMHLIAAEAGYPGENDHMTRAYVAVSEHGDTDLMICESCSYTAIREAARTAFDSTLAASMMKDELDHLEAIATPNCATIADLARFCGVPESATAKAVFFDSPERGLIFAVIRGDREINIKKLCIVAGVANLTPARPEQINAIGAVAGYASPVGLPGHTSNRVLIVADPSVTTGAPLIAGANRHGYHLRNVVYGRNWRADRIADISLAHPGDPCNRCGAPLRQSSGCTIVHAIHHGAFAQDATFLDQEGVSRPMMLASFRMLLERALLTIIEQHCDRSGIIWTPATAPFDVHLIRLGKQETTRQAADALYDELIAAGIAVLYDDRNETAGVKFNDADLIGLPLRLVIGDRFLTDGLVEIKQRATGIITKMPRQEIIAEVQKARTPAL